jgi:hypothetical protein
MNDTILSARGTPFKTERYALAAIKDKPGYEVVGDDEKGFVCVKTQTAEFNIICPGCGQSYHKTTNAYDPEVDANPAMIQLKEPWLGYGWDDLGKEPSMGYGCLVCPDCGTALAPSGKLRVV